MHLPLLSLWQAQRKRKTIICSGRLWFRRLCIIQPKTFSISIFGFKTHTIQQGHNVSSCDFTFFSTIIIIWVKQDFNYVSWGSNHSTKVERKICWPLLSQTTPLTRTQMLNYHPVKALQTQFACFIAFVLCEQILLVGTIFTPDGTLFHLAECFVSRTFPLSYELLWFTHKVQPSLDFALLSDKFRLHTGLNGSVFLHSQTW